jgi:hypothetical protein
MAIKVDDVPIKCLMDRGGEVAAGKGLFDMVRIVASPGVVPTGAWGEDEIGGAAFRALG